MVRNSGKFGKPKRGGGKHFTNARVLSAQDAEGEGMWGDKRQKGEDDDSEEESEEDEESESDSDDGLGGSTRAGPSRVSFASPPTQSQSTSSTSQSTTNQPQLKPGDIDKFGNVVQEPEMTKREAKKAAKAKEAAKAQQGKQAEESDSESDSDDPLLQAGSGNKTLNKQMKMSSLGDTAKKPAAAPQPMNRKEREEAAKKAARERYLEMHRAGKTDEAKRDLERLAKIRKDREEAAQRKAAEKASADQAKAEALAKSGRRGSR